MKFETIRAGETYYTVKRQRMGNTTMSTVVVHPVKVISVDVERRTIRASWNDNPERAFFAGDYKSWRATRPVLVGTLQKRLAPREDLVTMKAAKNSAGAV
ncbi:hypothetical protein [Duganella vulcania]|uniref:Uncharacterized protein n=1 Tax=Duganella vulcania TaxID=2692166 RepID=A0A845GF41_9BURK|nr:hypothetical protein [Duganella vulcania]MYM92541.1 hypothetical protein [Duganella vulcania]